jgi:hypothetical protein
VTGQAIMMLSLKGSLVVVPLLSSGNCGLLPTIPSPRGRQHIYIPVCQPQLVCLLDAVLSDLRTSSASPQKITNQSTVVLVQNLAQVPCGVTSESVTKSSTCATTAEC